MITAIVDLLKSGTVKNVVAFGSKSVSPPYAVVKGEQESGFGRRFRIIAHFEPGQQIMLEDYVRSEVPALLDGVVLTSRHGNTNQLELEDEYGDVVANNDDGTISMERCFLLPSPAKTF